MSRHSDYYHDENRKVRRERPRVNSRRVALWLLDVVMLVVTICAAVALLGGLLAKVVNPCTTPIFVFFGLFYQIVYLVNVACALWWVVRWRRWFFLSAAMLLVGCGSIGLFYRSDMKATPAEVATSRGDLVVASYNVMNLGDEGLPEGVSSYSAVVEWLNQQGVNIACIQEAHFSSSKTYADFKAGLRKMGYGFFTSCLKDKPTEQTGPGYVIASAYPIVRHSELGAEGMEQVRGVWADVKIERDTIRIYNLHLQSTGISSEERNATLSPQIIDDTLARAKLSKVVEKMVDNYRLRAAQAEEVAAHIEQSPHPVVVCGDFNDTPVSYVYSTIMDADVDLKDAFVACGRGTEYTFKGLYDLFRIDYLLADLAAFEIKDYHSYDLPYSDHKALKVLLGRK